VRHARHRPRDCDRCRVRRVACTSAAAQRPRTASTPGRCRSPPRPPGGSTRNGTVGASPGSGLPALHTSHPRQLPAQQKENDAGWIALYRWSRPTAAKSSCRFQSGVPHGFRILVRTFGSGLMACVKGRAGKRGKNARPCGRERRQFSCRIVFPCASVTCPRSCAPSARAEYAPALGRTSQRPSTSTGPPPLVGDGQMVPFPVIHEGF